MFQHFAIHSLLDLEAKGRRCCSIVHKAELSAEAQALFGSAKTSSETFGVLVFLHSSIIVISTLISPDLVF